MKKEIQTKKEVIEKEIENEISKAQKEIVELKKNSTLAINNISKEITSNIIDSLRNNSNKFISDNLL